MTQPIHALLHSSESNEWYTPAKYIEAARAVMGEIDLDPASCETANRTVQAVQYFTIDDNALPLAWFKPDSTPARVWLNPPYGRGGPGKWVRKLIKEQERGNVRQAVLLVSNATSTNWFTPLWNYPICFTDHRIQFVSPTNSEAKRNTHGSVFVYFGPNVDAFADVFGQFGHIVRPQTREMDSMSKGLSELQKNILIMANRHRTSDLRAKDSELSTMHGGLFGADLRTEQVITAVYGIPSNAARAAISRAFCRLEQRGLVHRVFGRYWAGINLTQEGIDTAVSVDKSEVIP